MSERGERGVALVMTLLVITLLMGVVVSFSDETGVEVELAGSGVHAARAYTLARSAVHVAAALMDKKGAEEGAARGWSGTESWGVDRPFPFPEELEEGTSVTGRVVDEGGKINVNSLLKADGTVDEKREAQLRRLFLLLGVEHEVVNPILDWLDADDDERPGGAEGSYYLTLPEPLECANGKISTLGELYSIKGMDKVTVSLSDYLTVYTDGKININTASKTVLATFGEEFDGSLPDAIIEYRKNEEFKGVEDLLKVPGMSQDLFSELREMLSVKGSAFTLDFEAEWYGSKSRIKAFALRGDKGFELVKWLVM